MIYSTDTSATRVMERPFLATSVSVGNSVGLNHSYCYSAGKPSNFRQNAKFGFRGHQFRSENYAGEFS